MIQLSGDVTLAGAAHDAVHAFMNKKRQPTVCRINTCQVQVKITSINVGLLQSLRIIIIIRFIHQVCTNTPGICCGFYKALGTYYMQTYIHIYNIYAYLT